MRGRKSVKRDGGKDESVAFFIGEFRSVSQYEDAYMLKLSLVSVVDPLSHIHT